MTTAADGGRPLVAVNALNVRPGIVDGSITFTLNLLRELVPARPDLRFVAFARRHEDRFDSVAGLELKRVAAAEAIGGRVVWELLGLQRALRSLRADVLLAPYESLPLLPPCPTVVVAQNLFYHRDGLAEAFAGGSVAARLSTRARIAYYRTRMPRAYKRAAAVIAVSSETKRVLVERAGLDPRKTTVVFEGSDSALLPDVQPVERARRLLVVSGLMPYKNLEQTVDVFAALRRDDDDVALEIVGADWRGYRSILEERLRRHGIEGSVHFAGSVEPEQLAELYTSSLALLHLSDCESFGLPVLEAMRYGTPVVAADRSSLPEVAGGAALLVDPDAVDETAARVRALLADESLQRDLGERGRARAAELTWRHTAAGIAAVLDRVLEG